MQGLLIALLAAAAWVGPVAVASADNSLITTNDGVVATTREKRDRAQQRVTVPGSSSVNGAARSEYTYLPKGQYKSQMGEHQERLAAVIAANNAATNARGQCIDTNNRFGCNRFTQ